MVFPSPLCMFWIFFFGFGLVPFLFWTTLFASWGSVGFPSVLCQEAQCRFQCDDATLRGAGRHRLSSSALFHSRQSLRSLASPTPGVSTTLLFGDQPAVCDVRLRTKKLCRQITQQKKRPHPVHPYLYIKRCRKLLWWRIEIAPIFGLFGLFLLVRPVSGEKNGDFLVAQPPKRSFHRPVRWYLGYLRARDIQSATLPLVYVTCGGSNLPVRPQNAPKCLWCTRKTGGFPRQERGFSCLGASPEPPARCPSVAFSTPPKSRATARCAPKENSTFAKNKTKIARRN